MIKVVLLDIDGVLTDGKVTVDSEGREYKTIDFKDIDAVFEMKRRGLKVGLITGEGTPITVFFKERFQPDYFYNGCKDKVKALEEILSDSGCDSSEVCFMGDSKHDAAVMKVCGLSACPADAASEAKEVATLRLSSNGGSGCVRELLKNILE